MPLQIISNRKSTSDICSGMVPAHSNSSENRSLRSSGKMPYKILRFPSSKCALWSHIATGSSEKLHIFNNRILKVNIQRRILNMGRDMALSEDQLDNFNFALSGKVVISQDGGEILFHFDKGEHPKLEESKRHSGLTDCYAPLNFSVNSLTKRMQYEEKSATEWLLNSAMQKEAIAYHRFIFWKSSCHFEKSSDGIFSSLQFSVLTLPNTFLLSPISQVAIIPTALSKGLADPVGNTFLHGEPKSGYITMDETRRILLVLDSDPKVTSLPLIGIWISGIHSVQHPYTWTCCMRYIHNRDIQERICCPPDPFMLLIYEKPKYLPRFYDCIMDPLTPQDTVIIYSGGIGIPAVCSDNFQTVVCVNLDKQYLISSNTNGNLLLAQEREDDFVTLKHKCSNSTSQSKSQLDDRNPSNGTPGSLKTNGLHVHNVARASPKQNIESNIRGSDKHGVRDFQKTSTDNMCSCSVNCNVIREENIWRDPHGNSKQEPSGKHDVYELLMAQEQQLKELKEQLETLIRERKDTSSSTSPVSIPKSADNEVLEKLKCTGVKQTNSAGTMTSFAWPMSSSRNVNCTPKHDGKEHFIQIDISDKNSTVSPEVLRRQSIMSIVSEDDDIMRNLQLPNFGNSVDTSQYSDIIVDLPGYPDSLSDMSSPHHSRSSSNFSNDDIPASDGSKNAISTNAEIRITEGDDSNFYDNLLRRIETILSKQSTSNVNQQDSEESLQTSSCDAILPNERHTVDSLLIPHLNYLSIFSNESDNDRSFEFQLLALKYLGRRKDASLHFSPVFKNNVVTTSIFHLRDTTATNFSFATKEYLKKYGLYRDDDDHHENSQDRLCT